jgi:hypothetical protein
VNAGQLAAGTGWKGPLLAAGRSPEIPEAADCYGWLAGSWALEVRNYWGDVRGQGLTSEAHFGWVLEGRAMQDVWILPRRADRTAEIDRARNSYGTTLRVWDPRIEAWRVTWINPVTGARADLVGRWSGKDVVQIGSRADGAAIRWIFSGITADAFRWTGESLAGDGQTWRLEGEFLARRVEGAG